MKATVTERGQVSIPAQLRREMQLDAGQTVLWEKVSATECWLLILSPELNLPSQIAALSFACQHGLEESSSDDYLRDLRAGEGEEEVAPQGMGGLPATIESMDRRNRADKTASKRIRSGNERLVPA